MNEQEIFEQIKKDKNNFDKLYNLFKDEVYRFSFSIVQNRQEAEDISAKAFLELYRSIDGFEWKGISSKYWLFKAVKNFANEYFRKVKNEEQYENILDLEDQNINFVDDIIQKDTLNKVYTEIAKFDALERSVIALRIHNNLGYKEIGEILNLSSEAARKRFDRSIQVLRKIFDQKLITLALLYTAIYQAVNKKMPKNNLPPKFSNLENATNFLKKILTNPILNKAIPITLVLITAIGAGIGITNYINNQNKNNSQSNQIAQVVSTTTPTPTDTPISTPTDTPTQTPSPSATVSVTAAPITATPNPFKTFSNAWITFTYSSNYTVTSNTANQVTLNINGNILKVITNPVFTCNMGVCSSPQSISCSYASTTLTKGGRTYIYTHSSTDYDFTDGCGTKYATENGFEIVMQNRSIYMSFVGPTATANLNNAFAVISTIRTK